MADVVTSRSARFTPATGTLVTTPQGLRHLAAGTPSPELVSAGATDPTGRAHPALLDVVEALRDPLRGTARLAYKGRSMEMWRGPAVVALLMPADAHGRHTLVRVNGSSLPVAIARAAGLSGGPRPDPEIVRASELPGRRTVTRWWRLLCGPTARSPGAMLEVVDTTDGLYVVTDGFAVPSTAPAVKRLVAAAVDGLPTVPPLHHLPVATGLPRAHAR